MEDEQRRHSFAGAKSRPLLQASCVGIDSPFVVFCAKRRKTSANRKLAHGCCKSIPSPHHTEPALFSSNVRVLCSRHTNGDRLETLLRSGSRRLQEGELDPTEHTPLSGDHAEKVARYFYVPGAFLIFGRPSCQAGGELQVKEGTCGVVCRPSMRNV